ncbi:hypothetical protein LCGC14_0204680 [marine sediment metagenome]|uniref:Ice-binding protein C-terminal domain-containing protein n=1 Tax=marine sediment metagenome TaxID=412755 RepID=A0A0F9UHL5_9ZZZZ
MLKTAPLCAAAVAAVVLLTAPLSHAFVVSYGLDIEFSGGSLPAGAGPWLKATFDDEDTPGSVELTLEVLNLVADEFVSKWYFNLNSSLDPKDLTFSDPLKIGLFDDPKINLDADGWNVAGSGRYDIEMAFATSNQGSGAERFGVGESASFTITGIATLTASSFDLTSTGGGNGAYPVAAHVQAINGDDGGWTSAPAAVPEPATLGLLTIGSLVMLRRRRARSNPPSYSAGDLQDSPVFDAP